MFELTRGLVSRLLVCNATRRASKGNNSDKPDALRLAQVLRAGMPKAAYHGSPSTQTLKQLVHCYDSLTEDTTRVMNRIKALFGSRAMACAGRDVCYSLNRSQGMGKLLEEGLRLRAEFPYKQLGHLRPLSRDAGRRMLQGGQRHPAYKRLCGVPGLGPVRV